MEADYKISVSHEAARKARRAEVKAIQSERKAEDVSDQPITGELHNWQRQYIPGSNTDFVIWGHIHNDIRGRFPDGTWVRTSLIARIDDDVAITLNSNYRLIGEEKGTTNDD